VQILTPWGANFDPLQGGGENRSRPGTPQEGFTVRVGAGCGASMFFLRFFATVHLLSGALALAGSLKSEKCARITKKLYKTNISHSLSELN